MRTAAFGAMILLAGCGPSPASSPKAAAGPAKAVTQMLKDEDALNETCRGGSGDDPATLDACKKRDELIAKLNAAGMCYGPPDLPMYQQKWGPCPAQPVEIAAVEPSASDPSGGPPDKITLTPGQAIKNAKVERYMAAADHCMHGRAESLLLGGARSRQQIREAALASCSTTLIRVLQDDGGLSAADATTGAQAMAGRAVEDSIARYGG